MWESTFTLAGEKSCALKNVCAQCQKNSCLEMSLRPCQRSYCSSMTRFTKRGRMIVLQFSQTSSNLEPLSKKQLYNKGNTMMTNKGNAISSKHVNKGG